MNTHVAPWTDAADGQVAPASTSPDPLAESLRMMGLAVIGSAAVVCLMWLVS